MDALISGYTKGSNASSLESLTNSLYSVSDRITQLKEKMTVKMENYYLKFAAMETALSELTSQSDWLASVLGTS
jgi:flagellar capping protein FliD